MKKRTSPGRKSAASDPADVGAPLGFPDQEAWASWLRESHATSTGVWLRIAKKGAGVRSVSYPEAIEAALCFGWIDGQKKGENEGYWLQRFTPRTARSPWSKINREKALRLIELGRMEAAGLREVERARRDGRWDRAYDPPSGATVPEDFQAVLDEIPSAKAFFATLDGRNRYAVLYRIQTAKKEETRARRIKQFAEMLSRREKIYP